MIIYIHGFGGSGLGTKASLFREYFKERGVEYIAPSLSYIPDLAISTLEELIENCKDPKLIGSSLGGFYTIYLTKKYNIKGVLINPAVKSHKTLERHISYKECAISYYDGSQFTWQDNHLEMLKKLVVDNPKDENLLLLLQKGDEVLDYKDALKKLPNAKRIVEDGGNHSFEGIERYFEDIEEFLLIK